MKRQTVAERVAEGTRLDIAKMSVSRKESRETLYWLRLAVRAYVLTEKQAAFSYYYTYASQAA